MKKAEPPEEEPEPEPLPEPPPEYHVGQRIDYSRFAGCTIAAMGPTTCTVDIPGVGPHHDVPYDRIAPEGQGEGPQFDGDPRRRPLRRRAEPKLYPKARTLEEVAYQPPAAGGVTMLRERGSDVLSCFISGCSVPRQARAEACAKVLEQQPRAVLGQVITVFPGEKAKNKMLSDPDAPKDHDTRNFQRWARGPSPKRSPRSPIYAHSNSCCLARARRIGSAQQGRLQPDSRTEGDGALLHRAAEQVGHPNLRQPGRPSRPRSVRHAAARAPGALPA